LGWIVESKLRFILAVGVFFALVTFVPEVLLGLADGARTAATRPAPEVESPEPLFVIGALIRFFLALLVFGVFLGVIVVTEEEPEYARSGLWIRMACGTMAGAVIAVLGPASWEGVAVCASIGCVLGYFGKRWAYHL
jgi:hypothetical protein